MPVVQYYHPLATPFQTHLATCLPIIPLWWAGILLSCGEVSFWVAEISKDLTWSSPVTEKCSDDPEQEFHFRSPKISTMDHGTSSKGLTSSSLTSKKNNNDELPMEFNFRSPSIPSIQQTPCPRTILKPHPGQYVFASSAPPINEPLYFWRRLMDHFSRSCTQKKGRGSMLDWTKLEKKNKNDKKNNIRKRKLKKMKKWKKKTTK